MSHLDHRPLPSLDFDVLDRDFDGQAALADLAHELAPFGEFAAGLDRRAAGIDEDSR